MKSRLAALAAFLCLGSAPLFCDAAAVGVKDLAGLISAGDPRLRISAQSLRAASAAYRSAIAAAYPQVTLGSSYSLDLVPDLQIELPTQAIQETQNQGTHFALARLSLSQLLPTAGTLQLAVEDTMKVKTATGMRIGDADFESVDPSFTQYPKATVSLTQPIFVNGKIVDLGLFPATLRKAELGYLRSREDNRDLLNSSLTAAVQSLFGVLQLRKSIQNGAHALELAEERLEQARRNLELGIVAELDVWEMEVAVGSQRETLLDLRHSLARAERQLAQSLGRDDATLPPLDDAIPALAIELSREELVRQALARHPGIQAGALDLEGRKLDKTIAGQQDATTVTLSFGVQPNYPSTRDSTTFGGSFSELGKDGSSIDWSFGVGVSVPVYQGGKKKSDAEGADALQRIAEDNLLLARQRVVEQIDSTLLDRSSLEERVTLLDSNSSLLARRVEIERGLLTLGKSTDLDVEAREVDLEAKRLELWKARADLFVTIITLYAQTGEDLERIIEGEP